MGEQVKQCFLRSRGLSQASEEIAILAIWD